MKKIYHPIPLGEVTLFCQKHYIEKMSLIGVSFNPTVWAKKRCGFPG